MKKIFNILLVAALMVFAVSCVDEDLLFELDDFPTGALPNLQRTSQDDGFIDLLAIQNGEPLNLEFTIGFEIVDDPTDDGVGKTDPNTEYSLVESVQLEVAWDPGADSIFGTGTTKKIGLIESGTIRGPISSWPATITITDINEIVDAIPSLAHPDSIRLGDSFTFVCSVKLADGRELPAFVTDPDGNKTPNFSISFSGNQNNPGYDFGVGYAVSCLSEIPLGAYDGVTVGPFGTTNAVVNVTAGPLPGVYACDDLSAGMLGLLIGDPTFLGGGAFQDVCNEVSVPTFAPPGLVNVMQWANNLGSYDPETGVIVMNWDIVGFQHTTTLTPQ